MDLSEEVAGLGQRVVRFEARVDQHFEAIDERFEAIDARFDAVDRRFEAVDKRFEAVDKRFDAVDARFDELKRHFDVIAEASRDDFRNLYDLFQAHMHRMEERIDTVTVTLRAEMKLGDDVLDSRVTALERNEAKRRTRTRR